MEREQADRGSMVHPDCIGCIAAVDDDEGRSCDEVATIATLASATVVGLEQVRGDLCFHHRRQLEAGCKGIREELEAR